jgi:hypothetical protein
MQNRSTAQARKSVMLSVVVLGLLAALIFVPKQFQTEAVSNDSTKRGLINRTESHVRGLENYDIRTQKNPENSESLLKFREESGKSASAIADTRDSFVRGEESLRVRVKSLKVEYNEDLRNPEVITPDVYKANVERLTGPSRAKNADTLRSFAKQYNQLVGMEIDQLDNLKVAADYTNPSGNMAFAHLRQEINGIQVFRGEIKAGFTANGEIVRVINNLAPGLDYDNLSVDFGDPLRAVRAAAGHINYKLQSPDITRNAAASTDTKTVFGEGSWATTAEKMYFPTEIGVARTAWRVLIWQPVNAFYVIVDAQTGKMLWRKNITEDQTQSATYNVYDNTNAFMNAADSPAPLSPGPIDPGLGTQGALGTRTDVTLIGNEGPLAFNTNGWITDGANGTDGHTDGNATEAGLDIDGSNGVDAPTLGTGRVFTSAWNPPPGNPGPGEAPTTPDSQFGAIVQMFYVMNRYHDSLYQLGFTEPAFNFQDDNFGRGGNGGDRISSEGQDSSGTNNANFSTPADGGRGRMQMYRFTGSTPDRDGTSDADIIVHEATHGTSNRLVGNSSGLGTNMARGMGEGWSDFYAHSLLSEASDPANGVYAAGGYSTLDIVGGFDANYYYGIRRFPKAIMAFTGGPGNNPHNPLTFADLNSGCDLSDGAFGPGPIGSSTCDQVHNAGEVWSTHLWEVRNLMIDRLGFAAGNERVLQVVTDGLKLAPLNPTFIQSRDAIIAAAAALPVANLASADVADVREGFRIRGMGFSAEILSTGPANVVEAFDFPNVQHVNPFAVSDAPGNGNGFPEPGESLLLSVPVTNATGATVTNVKANVSGGTDVSYGDIPDGSTVTMEIAYTVPGGEACGANHQVQINVTSDAGAQAPVDRAFSLGQAVGVLENFDGVTAPDLPADWTSSVTGVGGGWASRTDNPNSGTNSMFAEDNSPVGQSFLESPVLAVSSASTSLKFKMHHDVETGFDGVVLDINIASGGYEDIITAGGSFVTGGYNDTISTSFSSDIGGREAWSGNSAGYFDVEVQLPPAAVGQNVQFRWNMATDSSVTDVGVDIDDFEYVDSFICQPVSFPGNGRADFDGDGRTDISVFRPSEGNWYMNNSTDGFSAINFGLSGDTPVPGDYDGDGKADTAIFRPSDELGTPDWWVLNSNGFTLSGAAFGSPGDIPVVGDYDGDGNDDFSVWRESDTTWYTLLSSGGVTLTTFGAAGDTPVGGDFDGDGKADMATFNAGTWTAILSSDGSTGSATVGQEGDIPVPGDFDGNGESQPAVFRPSDGNWYILQSDDSTLAVPFGASGDIPAPGDYDGDGKDDVAVYRNGDWWVNASTSGLSVTQFGLASDLPVVANAN